MKFRNTVLSALVVVPVVCCLASCGREKAADQKGENALAVQAPVPAPAPAPAGGEIIRDPAASPDGNASAIYTFPKVAEEAEFQRVAAEMLKVEGVVSVLRVEGGMQVTWQQDKWCPGRIRGLIAKTAGDASFAVANPCTRCAGKSDCNCTDAAKEQPAPTGSEPCDCAGKEGCQCAAGQGKPCDCAGKEGCQCAAGQGKPCDCAGKEGCQCAAGQGNPCDCAGKEGCQCAAGQGKPCDCAGKEGCGCTK